MKTWLIRHQDLSFSRPVSETELIEKIESGDVIASDEISPATGYWFSIQEVDEVLKHFGQNIRLQALIPTGVDKTSSTNTAILIEKSRTDKIYTRGATTVIPSIIPDKKIKLGPMKEIQETPLGPRIAFGGVLVVIFFGTQFALWWGSQ